MIGIGNNQLMKSGIKVYTDGGFGVMAGYNSFQINKSTNYGATWSLLNGAGFSWMGIGISETGQYITAVQSEIFGPNTGDIYVSSNYGVTFTAKSYIDYWHSCDMSYTGQYQLATAWDATGTAIAKVLRSTDYGVSWTIIDYNVGVQGCGVSGNGQYMLLGYYNSAMILSSNYGSGWDTLSLGSRYWSGAALSNSGQYQTLTVSAENILFVSSDYGVNWTEKTGFISPYDIRMSGTGQYQFVTNDGYLQKSSNYGVTWATITGAPSRNWKSIDCSYSGQYVIAYTDSFTNNYVHYSNDYGVTWTTGTTYYNVGDKGLRLNKLAI
jgi:hypothetical protein